MRSHPDLRVAEPARAHPRPGRWRHPRRSLLAVLALSLAVPVGATAPAAAAPAAPAASPGAVQPVVLGWVAVDRRVVSVGGLWNNRRGSKPSRGDRLGATGIGERW